jgi:hypothetical protein
LARKVESQKIMTGGLVVGRLEMRRLGENVGKEEDKEVRR